MIDCFASRRPRVKVLLRRPGDALGAVLSGGNIALDTVGRDVRIGDAVLALPRRESAILEHLIRRTGRVVPKAVLEEKLYGIDDELGGAFDVFGWDGSGYGRIARIPTVAGARTSLFVPNTDRLYLAVRATLSEPAAIWVFRPVG